MEIDTSWGAAPGLQLVVDQELPVERRGGAGPIWTELNRARTVGEKFGDYRRSLTLHNQFIQKYALMALGEPGARSIVARAMYNKGVTYERLTEIRHAIDTYQELIDHYGQYSLHDSETRELVIAGFFRGDSLRASVAKDLRQSADEYAAYTQMRREKSVEFIQLFLDTSLDDTEIRKHLAQILLTQAHVRHDDGDLQSALIGYQVVITYFDSLGWFGKPWDRSEAKRDILPIEESVTYALLNRAAILQKLGRAEEAVAALSDLIERFRLTTESDLQAPLAMAMFFKANAFATLHQSDKEVAAFEDLIASFDESTDPAVLTYVAAAFINKAAALHAMNRSPEAIADFNQVCERFTTSDDERLRQLAADALVRKGVLLQSLGFQDDAVKIWKKAITLFGAVDSLVLSEAVGRANEHIARSLSSAKQSASDNVSVDFLHLACDLKSVRGDAQQELIASFLTIVDQLLNETRSYEAYLIYLQSNSHKLKEWKDVGDVSSREPRLSKIFDETLDLYFESRKVPRGIRPHLAARLDGLIEEAKAEALLPSRAQAEMSLSDEDLADFFSHAQAHPWKPRSGILPAAFIRKEFAQWLGHGLRREHVARAQSKLAEAYGGEIHRNPERRIKELLERPRNLPPGTPAKRPPTGKLTSEMTAEELEARRAKVRESARRTRARSRADPS